MDVASRLTATESIDEQCALNMMMLVSPPSSPRVSSLPFSGCRTERQEHRQCWARQEGRRRRRGGWWSATAPSPPSSWLGHHLNGPLSFRLGLIGLGSIGLGSFGLGNHLDWYHLDWDHLDWKIIWTGRSFGLKSFRLRSFGLVDHLGWNHLDW